MQKRYQSFFNYSLDCIFINDLEGNFIDANPAALNLLGYKKEDITSLSYASLLKPSALSIELQTVKIMVTDRAPSELLEFELTHKNGNKNFVESIASPVYHDGKPYAIIGIARDISKRKLAVQAEAMRAGLLASLGELSAGVAHEINNPINGVINYAEILKDECEEKGEDADIPIRIIKEGERIATIVKNLLSFARDRKENRSFAYINEILTDTLSLIEKQIMKDGIELTVDIPHDLPGIKVRIQEIQQVFLNLLSNVRHALNQKFSGYNQNKRIEIQGKTINFDGREYIRITFYDRGTGILSDILDKICNPFFSTKPKGEGTGLGA